jgi:transcription elongation factor GreA
MSENLQKNVNELLNQEKWTRAALNSYSVTNFKELDEIISKVRDNNVELEVKETCEEHLKHSKNSIIALYLAGVISLSKQLVDDSNLVMLIDIFSDNHKWNIVEFLCLRILEYGENKFALRTLAECYENSNEQTKKVEAWKRLIRVDYEEADIVKHLAEIEDEAGNLESAVDYYKKSLHRFVNKKMFSNVKETWSKLIDYSPDDIEFFFRVEKKVATTISEERAAMLLHSLFPVIKAQEDWETAIVIVKKILEYEPKNSDARKELVECYKSYFSNHSQLDEYIRISNLNQSWRNVHDAINDFEKHIAFDVGNYVFHRSWGIGRISDIDDDVFVIHFANRKNHKMSLKMAVNALKILTNDHIWVLKGTMAPDDLKEKVKGDPAWALRTIIKSFDNVANMKTIKAELVPSVLTQGEWSKWNTEARKILKTDPAFGNLPEKRDLFEVRDIPISFEEKTFNKFRAEKNFFGRVQTVMEFLPEAEPDSDYFKEMFAYFTSFLKAYSSVSEIVISSYLLVQRIVAIHPYLNPGLDMSFEDLFEQIEDLPAVFSNIEDNELRKEFLMHVKRYRSNWPEIFADLFRFHLSKYIIDELLGAQKMDTIRELFEIALSRYREYRESFVWLVRNLIDEPWFSDLEVPEEKILICLIHLLDITYREINNRRDVSLNRRMNRQIQDFLFKEEKLANHLMKSDEDSINRLYTLVEDVRELDPSIKIRIKQKIKERFPDFKFIGEAEIETVSRGLLVTRAGYEAKQRELRTILEVEIPQNSKDIGVAMEKGDLRENAEYKAALERQDLLNNTAAKLQSQLQEAQIFDETHIDTVNISFGTTVMLQNLITEEVEEYTILGPWESAPSENIISYLSPLGTHLLNHKTGDELTFTINKKEFHYRVESIERVAASAI